MEPLHWQGVIKGLFQSLISSDRQILHGARVMSGFLSADDGASGSSLLITCFFYSLVISMAVNNSDYYYMEYRKIITITADSINSVLVLAAVILNTYIHYMKFLT